MMGRGELADGRNAEDVQADDRHQRGQRGVDGAAEALPLMERLTTSTRGVEDGIFAGVLAGMRSKMMMALME